MEITGDWHGIAINKSKRENNNFVYSFPKIQSDKLEQHTFHMKMFTSHEFEENINKKCL